MEPPSQGEEHPATRIGVTLVNNETGSGLSDREFPLQVPD